MRNVSGPNGPISAPTVASQPPTRRWLRRRYQVVAAVGITAVLGSGASVAMHIAQRQPENRPDAHDGPAAKPDAVNAPGASARTTGGAPTPGASAGAIAPPAPDRTLRAPALAPAPAVSVTVTNSGSIAEEHHTLRVVSARADLSGQRELAWVADSGRPVGTARCTQNFQFSPDSPAAVRPTMLLCWRTSANKSVYTVAVDLDHPPSEQAAVATIDRVWSDLG
jgi:hypothetical protein